MKKLVVPFVILFFVITFVALSRHNNSNAEVNLSETQKELHYSQQLNALTSNILDAQHATALSQLDCKQIADTQFFSVGNFFMNMLFGSEQINQEVKQMNDDQTITQTYIQLGKYYLTCPNALTAIFPTPQTQQQYGEAFDKSINDVLQSQHVTSVKQLDCKKITDSQLVDVGDRQMDLMVGNDTVHAKVDKLFGKNAQSLESIHKQAGQLLLGCTN